MIKSPFVELDISDVALCWDCEVASSVDLDFWRFLAMRMLTFVLVVQLNFLFLNFLF